MRSLLAAAVLLALPALAACGDEQTSSSPEPDVVVQQPAPASDGGGVLRGTQPLLNGDPQDLAAYRGKVVLVVNTASECGFAPQFEGLEALYRERRDEGLVVLGFPADDVVGQEPRSDEEIAEFCRRQLRRQLPDVLEVERGRRPGQPAVRLALRRRSASRPTTSTSTCWTAAAARSSASTSSPSQTTRELVAAIESQL